MTYTTFCMIMAIAFWVLAALAVVTLMAYVYTQVQYYHWDKQVREQKSLVENIESAIKKVIEEQKNFDPVEADKDQYDNLEDVENT